MSRLWQWLFPISSRSLPYGRGVNIALRTGHIGVTGILCGGHMFGAPAAALYPWLWAAIATGGLLLCCEAYPHGRWLYQGRGALVGTKLLLLLCVPWCWEWRSGILLLVVALASVGSHMPARFRYYSLIHRRVVDDRFDEPSPPGLLASAGEVRPGRRRP